MESPSPPYKRLSLVYFWYYGLLGITHPFWALFLVASGFTAAQTGVLLAIQMATRMVSPGLWGWLADRSKNPMHIVRLGALFGCLSFAGIFWADNFATMALVMAAYSFFWNALMPQFEALTLDYLSADPKRYSHIRLWGSVGFIAAVILGGWWFERHIIDFRIAGLLFLVLIWLSTLLIQPRPKHGVKPSGESFWGLVVRRPVLAFLAVSFLLQVAHGIYYTLYSLHLEQAGYSRADIGLFWALSVVAEIVLFAVMHRLMTNFSLRGILVFSLLTAAIRWLLIVFFVEVVAVQIVAQCLHAFSFGACHAVSMEYLRRFFPSHQRGRGQAIYTSLSFGAGGALGALAGGQFWAISPVATFVFATLVSVVAAIIAYIWLDGRRQSSQALAELLL